MESLKARVEWEPFARPLTKEEVEARIEDGWVLAGQCVGEVGSNISTPNNPDGKKETMPVNIWVRDMTAVPTSMVARALVDAESKEEMSQALFGTTPEQLEEALET